MLTIMAEIVSCCNDFEYYVSYGDLPLYDPQPIQPCPGNHSHPSQIEVLKVTLSRASQRTNSQIQFVIMMGNIIFEILGQGGEGHTPKKDQAAKRNQTFNLIDALKLRLDLKSRCSNGRHQRRRSCDADQTRWASKPPYLERDWR